MTRTENMTKTRRPETVAQSRIVPRFEWDPTWPKPLPNNWRLGQVSGVSIDTRGHIWITHRPRTLGRPLEATVGGMSATFGPPAPPVLEFDQVGNLIQAWGDPPRVTSGRKTSMASISITRTTSGCAGMDRMTISC